MFAIIAIILFVLAFFGVEIDGHELVSLGLAFLAAHHVFEPYLPAVGPRRQV